MTFRSSTALLIRLFAPYQKSFYVNYESRSISASSIQRCSNKLSGAKEKNINKSGTSEDCTLVGPPHPVSNLRLKVFPHSKKLTPEERDFYQKSRETQEWNQQYWESHNKDFSECKESFIQELIKRKDVGADYSPSMDEMAEFYRQFLDRNYEKHVSYNWQWYRKNFYLIFLSVKAQLSKLKRSNRLKS